MRRRRDDFGQLGVHLHRVWDEMSLVVVVRRKLLLDVDAAARLVFAAGVVRVTEPGVSRPGGARRRDPARQLARYKRTRVRRRHLEPEAAAPRHRLLLLLLLLAGATTATCGTEAKTGEDDDRSDDDE